MQVEPIRSTLKAPGSERLKLECNDLLSSFAFKFSLRPYIAGLDDSVKNFLTSVPLVADLRSPDMRDRHWKQLMDTTGGALQVINIKTRVESAYEYGFSAGNQNVTTALERSFQL